jgi:phosphoribosylamine---glycine ligase
MKILVIGSGGREHALIWKIKQSPKVSQVFCVPGNAGISEIAETSPINQTDIEELIRFVKNKSIAFTIVGSEQSLTEGIVDAFEAAGLMIFGPSKRAAELERSKVFAKEFMSRYKIPTANFKTFSVDTRYEAERYINEIPIPIVIKADGLADGKGVTVSESKDAALDVLDDFFTKKTLGQTGEKVVIEDYMVGEELSVHVITDGKDYITLPAAKNYKRILDGDLGKNTGGMGAYAPTPFVTDNLMDKIKRTIIKPTIYGMKKEGRIFKGCLYFDLMLTETGPRVVEYNCHFGDPEAQVVLPLIKNDLMDLMLASVKGEITKVKLETYPSNAVCVVIASRGYPDAYETDKPIFGLDKVMNMTDVYIFHSGTKIESDSIVTAGGRVIAITAVGEPDKLEETILQAYRNVEKITFDGAYYRSDIGKKVLGYKKE